MSIRLFYHGIDQVDSIFSSKVTIKQPPKLPKNLTALNLGDCDKTIKLLSCSILMRAIRNWPSKLYSIFDSENIASPRFHAVTL